MRIRPFLIAFIVLALAVSGCTIPGPEAPAEGNPPATPSESSQKGEITLTDALGRSLTFDQAPQRIVLAGKAVFMIADAIYMFPEAAQRVVASGNTAQGKGTSFIPSIDPAFEKKILLPDDVGTEEIAGVKPDAVILKSYLAEKMGKPLEEVGIPVVYIDFETPEQYPRDIAMLGALFQNEARARELTDFYRSKLDMVSKPLADLKEEDKPSVLLLYYNDKDGTAAFNVPPMSWMQTSIVKTGGGKPVWEDANLSQGWTKVGMEQIAAWDADQIFVIAYFNNLKDVIEKMKTDTQWQELRAVKEGKLYGFAGDLISWDQPDTRWILGQIWMAKMLHPDLFKEVDMRAEIKTFYSTLYGMDDAKLQKIILSNLMGDLP